MNRKDLEILLREKRSFPSCNLKGANFSGMDLSGCDLSGLDLSGAQFKKTKLTRTRLDNSVLKGCFFLRADLSDCSAEKANFKESRFFASCLDNGRFHQANFEGADLSEVKARGVSFSGARLSNAVLEGSRLDDADITNADLTNANFSWSSLFGMSLSGVTPNRADFRYSRGLSKKEKDFLEKGGAKVTRIVEKTHKQFMFVLKTPWALLSLFIIFIAIGLSLFFYSKDISRQSISTLLQRLQVAKQAREHERVLQINSVLIKKFKKKGRLTAAFNRSIDTARVYRMMENTEKSLETLNELLNSYGRDDENRATILLESALVYRDTGDHKKSISILENIDHTGLNDRTIYLIEMNVALSYKRLDQLEKAATVYERVLKRFKNDSNRFSRISRNLAGVLLDMGRIEDSTRIWTDLLWNSGNPMPFFLNQMEMADKLVKAQRYEDALYIYKNLLQRLESYPEMENKIKARIGSIEEKLQRKTQSS